MGLRGGFTGLTGAVVGSGKLRELPPFFSAATEGAWPIWAVV